VVLLALLEVAGAPKDCLTLPPVVTRDILTSDLSTGNFHGPRGGAGG
jgi:hypothetical protein